MWKDGNVLVAAVLVATALTATVDGFVLPPTFVPDNSGAALFMGKSQTMPGPAGKASSGKATSDFRQKKMSERLTKKNRKKKKKAGGFGGSDDGDDSGATKKKSSPLMEIELVAEPEGGAELKILPEYATIDEEDSGVIIRVKDLGVVDSDDKAAYEYSRELGKDIHNFWVQAVAEGSEISKTRTILLKDASKNANFPGFRKGQIPPYAQPKMTNFALRDAIVSGCELALKQFGVESLDPENAPQGLGEVTFHEDVDAISNKYNIKTCPSVPFTANFKGTFVNGAPEKEEEGSSDDSEVVEAEIVEKEESS